MMQPIERAITNPSGQIARRLIGKLIGDELRAEMSIQMNRMERAARAMYGKLKSTEKVAERRMQTLMRLGQLLDTGGDSFTFDDEGRPQIRRDLKKVKKADMEEELKGAWSLIEQLIEQMKEASGIIEDEILMTGGDGLND